MSYLRHKDRKYNSSRKKGTPTHRGPKRAPSICLDPIMCDAEWRDESKDRKQSWITRLLTWLGL